MSKFNPCLGLPNSDSSDASDSENEPEEPVQSRRKVEISFEDLKNAGYISGPSVLTMRPVVAETTQDWSWSKGDLSGHVEETTEEQQAMRDAVTRGADETAAAALKAQALEARRREDARLERETQREAAQQKLKQQQQQSGGAVTFNQKEKRKRDAGQASRGKSYNEEEKRLARSYGVYSGFDT